MDEEPSQNGLSGGTESKHFRVKGQLSLLFKGLLKINFKNVIENTEK